MQHRISAGALVLRDNQILLLRHQNHGSYDFWAPPGGGVEDNEELAAAAEREVFEEAGIQVRSSRLAYIEALVHGGYRRIRGLVGASTDALGAGFGDQHLPVGDGDVNGDFVLLRSECPGDKASVVDPLDA